MIANGTVTAFTTDPDAELFVGDELLENNDEKRLMKLLSIDEEDRLLAAIKLSLLFKLLSSRFVRVNRKSSIVLFNRNSPEFASLASFEDSSEDETDAAVVVVVVVLVVLVVVLVLLDGSRLLLVSSFIMLVGKSFLVNPDDESGLDVFDLNLELLLLLLLLLLLFALLDLLLSGTLRPFAGLFMNSRIEVMLPEFKNRFGTVVLLTNESLLKLNRFEERLTAGATVLVVVVEVLEPIGGLLLLLVRSFPSSSLEKPSSDLSSFELAPESDSGSLIKLLRLNSRSVFAGGGAVLVLRTGSRSLMRLELGDSLL